MNNIFEELEEFQEWLENLFPLDRLNFNALIKTVEAPRIIAKCPDPVLQRWAMVALAIQKLGII